MENKENIKNEYFWQQYNGLVRAIDLPQWYKEEDKRISCVNTECFVRHKCLFFERFYRYCNAMRENIKKLKKDVIIDQKQGRNRNTWDKYYPKLYYMLASFQFYKEQNGATPCECFKELIKEE